VKLGETDETEVGWNGLEDSKAHPIYLLSRIDQVPSLVVVSV
jgi:hypothetical protein